MDPNQTTIDEVEAAREIGAFLREKAAALPTHSQLRALALQSSECWMTIAGQQQARLQAVAELQGLAPEPSATSQEPPRIDEAVPSRHLSAVR